MYIISGIFIYLFYVKCDKLGLLSFFIKLRLLFFYIVLGWILNKNIK